MLFYGGISPLAKNIFTFDRIYRNRRDMDQSVATDEVLIGRYVIIQYGDNKPQYDSNKEIDQQQYQQNYDNTVWLKTFLNSQLIYLYVTKLKGDAATITIGSVTSGTPASVTNSGTPTDAILDFVLPKGEKGEPGVGIQLKGVFESEAQRDQAIPNPKEGYACLITQNGAYHLWSYQEGRWQDYGQLALTTIDDTSTTSTVHTWSAKKIYNDRQKKIMTWGDLLNS